VVVVISYLLLFLALSTFFVLFFFVLDFFQEHRVNY
jgi:hypothetical protein